MCAKLNNSLIGVTGEYFVAAELSKMGYIASITLRNTKGVDILCSNENATKTVGIQVKTHDSETREWILDKKAEDYIAKNLFYVFVTLNNRERSPDFFVVPSEIVANIIKQSHKTWLEKPNKKGGKHKDSRMRKWHDSERKYLSRWDLLGL